MTARDLVALTLRREVRSELAAGVQKRKAELLAQKYPAVTVNFEPWGDVEIFYDAAPAEPGNNYPGYFNVVAVMFGPHDILDEIEKRGLADWIKECAIEQLQENAKRIDGEVA